MTRPSLLLAAALPLALLLCHCSSAESTVVGGGAARGGGPGADPETSGAGAGDDPGTEGTGSGGGSGTGDLGDPVTADGGGGPRSCAEAKTAGGASDGVYVIDPDGTGPIAPLHVYCAGMTDPQNAPREYIELAKGTMNDSAFAGGGYCDCPTFVRTFTKVRFDPTKMFVDTSDLTFSTANRDGSCDMGKANCQGPGHAFFATPGSCVTGDDASGVAHVDLTGTDLHLDARGVFGAEGYRASGTADVSMDAKRATLKGGGACGYWSPSPAYENRLLVARD